MVDGRSAQRKAAEITQPTRGTGSEETGEGVGDASSADTDAAEEVEAAGRFRIYLGAALGVGKTYAMLSEGQRWRGRGADVVAGFVEAYGRWLTEELIDGLEVIPRKAVDYRGKPRSRRWTSTRSCADGPRSPWLTSWPTPTCRAPALLTISWRARSRRWCGKGSGWIGHPDLRDAYFGNYERVVYLAQTDDAELTEMARAAAARLGLAFERRFTGYGDLATSVAALA